MQGVFQERLSFATIFELHNDCWFLICAYLYIGDAAYVAVNYRTFLPFFLLGGMLFIVLVVHIILFKRLKPYHTVEQKHSKANGDVVELVSNQQEEATETEVTSL